MTQFTIDVRQLEPEEQAELAAGRTVVIPRTYMGQPGVLTVTPDGTAHFHAGGSITPPPAPATHKHWTAR